MIKNYVCVLILIMIYSCGREESRTDTTFFGGEIVNPTAGYVTLFKGEQVIDSVELDEDNRFEMHIDSLEEGLYHFVHRPEMQYVYLQRGDSLQLRLNTIAFDESLVFSGQGEEINNYLIELFLDAEVEGQVIRDSYMKLEPGAFTQKLDSLQNQKIATLDQLLEEGSLNASTYDLGRASILYKTWYYKESYPYWHRKYAGEKSLHELPEDFYDYRSDVVFDDPRLIFLRPYYDFMTIHVGNLAFTECRESCDSDLVKLRNQLHFNQHQLEVIDSLVPQEELRDNLFRTVAMEYLLKHDTEENFEVFMKEFHDRSANNRHLAEIDQLSDNIRNLRPNHSLPELRVTSTSGDEVMLGDISGGEKEVVFYFWAGPEPMHLQNIADRVRTLEEKYDKYRFVGICLKTDQDRWKTLIGNYNLDPENQYWADNYEDFAHSLVVYHRYKSIISKDGMIVDGFANLNTSF